MSEIVEFITTLLGAPLQLVLILLCLGLFGYFMIKIRPEERRERDNFYKEMRDRNERLEEINRKEQEKFFNAITESHSQAERLAAMYDKSLDYCSKVVENNTAVIQQFLATTQRTQEQVDGLIKEAAGVIKAVDRLKEEERACELELKEVSALIRLRSE